MLIAFKRRDAAVTDDATLKCRQTFRDVLGGRRDGPDFHQPAVHHHLRRHLPQAQTLSHQDFCR